VKNRDLPGAIFFTPYPPPLQQPARSRLEGRRNLHLPLLFLPLPLLPTPLPSLVNNANPFLGLREFPSRLLASGSKIDIHVVVSEGAVTVGEKEFGTCYPSSELES